jgi:hypothetical protein
MLLRTVDNYIPDYTVAKLRNPCTVVVGHLLERSHLQDGMKTFETELGE